MKVREKGESSKSKPDESVPKPETMDELRRPSTILPPTRDEFRIVSPGLHEPEGQTTHE